jgi:hypothetical protein
VRYYSIQMAGGQTYTSLLPSGATNPGALQVEFDIPLIAADLPTGDASVKIWGVPLMTIGQTNNLINKSVQVFGGFAKGLPLANPAQAGLLVQGYILNAFGNWIDTDQYVVLIIRAGAAPTGNSSLTGGTPNPLNVAFNWPQGQPMSTAIQNALTTAYPGYTVNMNISSNLVFSENQQGHYQNLTQFAQYVKKTSIAIIGGANNYAGVSIVLTQQTFNVFDGMGSGSTSSGARSPGSSPFSGSTSTTPAPTAIAFQDLIGQPSWQNAPLINFKCAMRADLKVGTQITLPETSASPMPAPG